jgi:hypothetical protein
VGGLSLFFHAEPPPPLNEKDLVGMMRQLNCSRLQNQKAQNFDINFFSCALKPHYEDMLLIYGYFALSSNADSVIEMAVRDSKSFVDRNYEVFSYLTTHYANSVCVREQDKVFQTSEFKGVMPNSIRFLEVPVVKADYVYLADTDILLTSSVLDPER